MTGLAKFGTLWGMTTIQQNTKVEGEVSATLDYKTKLLEALSSEYSIDVEDIKLETFWEGAWPIGVWVTGKELPGKELPTTLAVVEEHHSDRAWNTISPYDLALEEGWEEFLLDLAYEYWNRK